MAALRALGWVFVAPVDDDDSELFERSRWDREVAAALREAAEERPRPLPCCDARPKQRGQWQQSYAHKRMGFRSETASCEKRLPRNVESPETNENFAGLPVTSATGSPTNARRTPTNEPRDSELRVKDVDLGTA